MKNSSYPLFLSLGKQEKELSEALSARDERIEEYNKDGFLTDSNEFIQNIKKFTEHIGAMLRKTAPAIWETLNSSQANDKLLYYKWLLKLKAGVSKEAADVLLIVPKIEKILQPKNMVKSKTTDEKLPKQYLDELDRLLNPQDPREKLVDYLSHYLEKPVEDIKSALITNSKNLAEMIKKAWQIFEETELQITNERKLGAEEILNFAETEVLLDDINHLLERHPELLNLQGDEGDNAFGRFMDKYEAEHEYERDLTPATYVIQDEPVL
jgi:hypothetical protein